MPYCTFSYFGLCGRFSYVTCIVSHKIFIFATYICYCLSKYYKYNVDVTMPSTPPRLSGMNAIVSSQLSTPMMIRSGSVRDSDSKQTIHVDDLNRILEIELKNSIISNAKNLITTIFPDEYLPFKVNNTLLRSIKLYKSGCWTNAPAPTEVPFADWLNCIGNHQIP